MEQVLSPKDFVPRESVEKAGILDVFPFFHTAQLGQKIRRKSKSPPSGVALIQMYPLLLLGAEFMALCNKNMVRTNHSHVF